MDGLIDRPRMEVAPMPAPVPVPIRQALWQRARAGEPTAALAAAFGLPPRTVRHLLKRLRDRGDDGLMPGYRPGPRPAHAYPDAIRQAVLRARRDHPTWGAGVIRVALADARPEVARPPPRTIRRGLRDAGRGPAPAGRRPGAAPRRAAAPHETWQVDAAEHIRLGGGGEASWLRVVDEASGAVLGTAVFPHRGLDSGRPPRDPGAPAPAVRPVGPAGAAAGR
jgi:hypothetical protein